MTNATNTGLLALFALLCPTLHASAEQLAESSFGDRMLAEYFAAETEQLAERTFDGIDSVEDWHRESPRLRRQLMDMLGLDPLPKKTDLNVTITGKMEHDEFVVKKLHFQSLPGLYVTANLYLPKNHSAPLPAVLYVCGHGRVKKDGVSYGNKVHYHHHGSWFARNGYVCLTIDTIQLGEIEGIHHGTYREKMWWWLNRGYTPAGVEAWNCIRSLDFLETLPEVDAKRIGVTGRSGGGVYSWWIAAIDGRIRCAVPVAGITDLQNYVVDGVVEGHCDCMFMLNTYRWDYPMVAALVAPRPLLISNTDRDPIFPIDGVFRTYQEVRGIYQLLGAGDHVALHTTAGGHKDTQELRVHAFRWLNRHLRNDDSPILLPAEKLFTPEQLQVFAKLPDDQVNTTIQESFVPVAESKQASNETEWSAMIESWRNELMQKTFAGWPSPLPALRRNRILRVTNDSGEITLGVHQFQSQQHIPLNMYVLRRSQDHAVDSVVFHPVDQNQWNAYAAYINQTFNESLPRPLPVTSIVSPLSMPPLKPNSAVVFFGPRGIGDTHWNSGERAATQIRRRFYLLGQTLDGMRVLDIRRAVQAIRGMESFGKSAISVQAEGTIGAMAIYASMFEPNLELAIKNLRETHRHGPYLLNVRRVFDMPQAVAMAASETPIRLIGVHNKDWNYAIDASKRFGGNLTIAP